MIRAMYYSIPLLLSFAAPSWSQTSQASPSIFSIPAVSPESSNDPIDLLSNPMTGSIDGVAKSSANEIFERQRILGQNFSDSVSPENYAKLESLYRLHQYELISNYLLHYSADIKANEWIRLKAIDGNVPMMWLLADRYASVQTIDLAVKWAHSALLGTMQEQSTCLDRYVENAAAKISALHPHLVRLEHSNPFLSKEAKLFAMSILSNAPHYSEPVTWLCKPYSSPGRLKAFNSLFAYDAVYFPHLRAKARNELRRKYQIAQPMEPLPVFPPSVP